MIDPMGRKSNLRNDPLPRQKVEQVGLIRKINKSNNAELNR